MREILDLEGMGYTFSLEAGRIHYSQTGPKPNADFVRHLLSAVIDRRAEAVEFLIKRRHVGVSEDLPEQAQTPAAAARRPEPVHVRIEEVEQGAGAWDSVFGQPPESMRLLKQAHSHQGQPAEAELRALLDQWQADANPAHTRGFARRYAILAIDLGIPFLGNDPDSDLGAEGWRRWAETID